MHQERGIAFTTTRRGVRVWLSDRRDGIRHAGVQLSLLGLPQVCLYPRQRVGALRLCKRQPRAALLDGLGNVRREPLIERACRMPRRDARLQK